MLYKSVTWVAVVVLVGAGLLTFELFGDRAAPSEPTEAMIRRDLLVSRLKLGDVRLKRGDVSGALEAHRESLAIAEDGAAQDPTSETWQRDVAVIHFRISYGLKEAGALEEAYVHARTCVTIYRKLAAANPRWGDELAKMQTYLEGFGQ